MSRGRGARTAAYGSTKKARYGRARSRRRWLAFGTIVLLALIGVLPFLLQTPDTVRQAVYPLRYEVLIQTQSERYGLEPAFVAGVVYAESRFNSDVTSHKGAYGLMQILPETADFISARSGIQGDYREPRTNLKMGIWYLNYLDKRYLGDERLMLAAYNSGEGRVDGWISDESFDVRRDIPFVETRNYVNNVLEAQKKYERLYGRNLDRRP